MCTCPPRSNWPKCSEDSGVLPLQTIVFIRLTAEVRLGRPGHFEVGERMFHFSDRLTGNSHIAITRPAVVPHSMPDAIGIRIRARTDAGAFIFDGKPNAEGYLGKLVSEPFDAQSFDDALRKAYHAVAPSLSNWSAHLDVPVYVA